MVSVMNILVFLIFMGIIGAVIGWVTNIVAIRLLFRPYRSYKIPLLGWNLQGLIPKRQQDIAIALGNVVSTELITGQDVAHSLGRADNKEKIARKAQQYVEERILTRLPFVIPYAIQSALAEYAGKTLYQEVAGFLDNPQRFVSQGDIEEIKTEIKKIVEEKVLALDVRRLEEITYTLASKELKHIEILGGILGFLIGLVQGLIALYLR